MTVRRTSMRWLRTAVAAALAAVALCLTLGGAVASAKTLQITENASMHLVRKSGSVLYEKGTATGTLPGPVSGRFDAGLTKVSGTVTIRPNGGGSLTILVIGTPRSTGTVARFGGTMAVKSGTGKYARASGSGTFEGTVNRRTWAVSVTARARLVY